MLHCDFLKKKWIRSCNWYFKQTAKLVLHVSNYISNQSCGPASECKLVSFRFWGTHPHLHKVVPDLRAISYPFLRGMSENVRNYNSSELCFPVIFSRSRVCAFHRTGEEAKQPTSRSRKECFASFGKLVVLKVRRWTTFKGKMLTNTSLAGKTGHFPLAKLKSVVSWKEVPTYGSLARKPLVLDEVSDVLVALVKATSHASRTPWAKCCAALLSARVGIRMSWKLLHKTMKWWDNSWDCPGPVYETNSEGGFWQGFWWPAGPCLAAGSSGAALPLAEVKRVQSVVCF